MSGLMQWLQKLADAALTGSSERFIPDALKHDPELQRLARLHIRFGWLGLGFGLVYALFYGAVGHYHGASMILACSLVFGLVPWLIQKTGQLWVTGNLFSLVLVVGFAGLATVEGGLTGHAVGWLASVPLMTMLLLGIRPALGWTAVCVLVVAAFALAHAAGHHFPRTYPPEWETLIDAAGYVGLAPFLAFLGSIFERTRSQAQGQLQAALEKLSLANERLERLNKDKDEFLNIAAHDLRNPLGGIIGFAGVLKMPGEPNAALVKQAGETIESLGVRMNAILTNLLDIRRIEEGKLNLKPERCSYQDIVSEVVLSFRQQAEKKKITVLSELPADAPAFVGDRHVTAQIFENLLSNAIKYSNPGSTVRCTVDLTGGHVRLNVVDNGPGLSEHDQKNLFKKFSKLSPRPTAGENSNGLGLWIVQKMAQAMNGNVTCRSAQGQGSTFSLHLPVAA